MKTTKLASTLCLASILAALLVGCEQDLTTTPASKTSESANNARGNTLVRLVKQDNNSIQYNKSGTYFGLISKAEKSDSYTEYSYGSIYQSNHVMISVKQFNKTTKQLIYEQKFEIENGRCISSTNSKTGHSYQYKYNAQGLLDEVLDIHPSFASGVAKEKFTYSYNAATNSYRLTRIDKSDASGALDEKIFTYSTKQNNSFPNLDYIGYEVESYLPIFGTFSDALIESVEYNHFASGVKLYDKYGYTLDSDGYVTSRTKEFHPLGKANASMSMSSITFQFSMNWQGI